MRRAIFTAVLLLGAAAAQASEDPIQTIDAGTWAQFLEARTLYENTCAPCHGLKGTAGLVPYAPAFGLGEGLDDEFGLLLATVQEGVGFMPPWKDVLSYEEQEWSLTYAIALPGDNVYRQQCAACHEGAGPRVPDAIPRGAALDGYDGPLHGNIGVDVARTWTQEELAAVIRLLQMLDEER